MGTIILMKRNPVGLPLRFVARPVPAPLPLLIAEDTVPALGGRRLAATIPIAGDRRTRQ